MCFTLKEEGHCEGVARFRSVPQFLVVSEVEVLVVVVCLVAEANSRAIRNLTGVQVWGARGRAVLHGTVSVT